MNSMGGGSGFRSSSMSRGDRIPSGYKAGQIQQFTPEQMQLFKQLFGQVSPDSYLSKLAGGDEGLFDEMESPAMRQFSDLQGNLASRFSQGGGGQGALGARRSSGFQNSMTSAASNFASDLASQRKRLQQQAIQDLMGMSNSLLNQRPYERTLTPKAQNQSGWGGLLGAGLGAAAGYFSGEGMLKGASVGHSVGSGF